MNATRTYSPGNEEVNACPITSTAAARRPDGAGSDIRTCAAPLAGAGDGSATLAERPAVQRKINMAARISKATAPAVESTATTSPEVVVESAQVLASQARAALKVTDTIRDEDGKEILGADGRPVSTFSKEGLTLLAQSTAQGQARYAFVVWSLAGEPYGLTGKEISALTRLSEPSVSKLRLAGSLLARCGAEASTVAQQATAVAQKHSKAKVAELFDPFHGAALIEAIVNEEARIVAERAETRAAGAQTAAEKEAEAEAVAEKVAAERTPGKRLGRAIDALTAIESVEAEHRLAVAPLAVSVVAEGLRIAGLCGLSPEAVFSSIMERAAEAEARAVQAEADAAHVSTMAAAV